MSWGWHQFAVYNELVKDYFCSDGKDIYTSVIYSDDDPYANENYVYMHQCFTPLGTYPGTKFNSVTYNCYGEQIHLMLTTSSLCSMVIALKRH